MIEFIIVYEFNDEVKQVSCLGVDKFNAQVKELQEKGYTILAVDEQEV